MIVLVRICVVELEVVTKALTNKFLMDLEPSVGIIAVCISLIRPLFYRHGRLTEVDEMHDIPSAAGPGFTGGSKESQQRMLHGTKSSRLQ